MKVAKRFPKYCPKDTLTESVTELKNQIEDCYWRAMTDQLIVEENTPNVIGYEYHQKTEKVYRIIQIHDVYRRTMRMLDALDCDISFMEQA
jgi:hypothetical protein